MPPGKAEKIAAFCEHCHQKKYFLGVQCSLSISIKCDQNAETGLKVEASKNKIFRISYTEFDAEFVDRFANFLATKLT